jgi:hypothetical protein
MIFCGAELAKEPDDGAGGAELAEEPDDGAGGAEFTEEQAANVRTTTHASATPRKLRLPANP